MIPQYAESGLHGWRILKAVEPWLRNISSSATAAISSPARAFRLDSVVYEFLRGESPVGIAESFPAMDLEHIFGALAFYMANRETVDQYLRVGQQEFEARIAP
jgi:hypothetical protein